MRQTLSILVVFLLMSVLPTIPVSLEEQVRLGVTTLTTSACVLATTVTLE